MLASKTTALIDGIIDALTLDDTAKKVTKINMHAALSWSQKEVAFSFENIEDLGAVISEMMYRVCPDNAARLFAAVHLKSFLHYARESEDGKAEFMPKKKKKAA